MASGRSDKEYDRLFKILIIGDSNVGKTSVLLRYVDDAFNPEFQTTIGVDFKISTLEVSGKIVKLQLWDTAGQDRFRNIVASYYRGANGVFLMYDVTNSESFQSVSKWSEESQQYLQSNVPKLLVGNKSDLTSQREVSTEEGKALSQRLKTDFIETSAKTSANVKEAFFMMAKSMLETAAPELQVREPSVKITTGSTIRKGYCC
jgi:Ras-related protein Rab-1A